MQLKNFLEFTVEFIKIWLLTSLENKVNVFPRDYDKCREVGEANKLKGAVNTNVFE